MEWSGRAPAPPAIEAGKGRQRQGARYVSQWRRLDERIDHLSNEIAVLARHERPGPRKQCFLPDQEPSGRLTFAFDSIRPRSSSSSSSSNWRQTASDNRTLPASLVDSIARRRSRHRPRRRKRICAMPTTPATTGPHAMPIFLSKIYFAVNRQILSHVPMAFTVFWTLSLKKVRNQAI